MNASKLIIICGPTGIGKTSAAISLAEAIGTEIIGADSMQIYRYMDIGTAKPTRAEQYRVPHHMIDIVDPDEPYDAAVYGQTAYGIASRLLRQNKVPIVAGGTGLYIKSLLHGLFQSKKADLTVRTSLKEEAEVKGMAAMHARLCRSDPEAAKRIHPNDRFRILRALEVLATTGRSISDWQREHQFKKSFFESFKIGLDMDRAQLYRRINQRVDVMIDQGLLDEVRSLLAKGYTRDLKSMQSLGYRHMIDYLENRIPWETTIHHMKRDTRRYAKRQLTWFKADAEIEWIAPGEIKTVLPRMRSFISE